ncbi:hypothetical protein C1631_018310 [Chryseobacterium phosphatilyticum]|uniref:Uncharacterized protein n=1 Tax=Chryseobacterium phosphatilyticum TaxID=475075 RepID=A0A316XCW2_9FLAO|nr:FISUMP domain-containing protein [Chryseobacterium phosphatilyticum]PWN68630.1 hypothetical protein C1631_018310 [Chryseobacterium phosphatilyticum]
MKKKLFLSIYFSISSFAVAQVGINKANPYPSADLELGSTNKSLLLNRVPNTGAINAPINGMLIYDVSEQCVKAFQGGAWSKCFWKDNPSFTLVCSSASFTPTSATQGQSYTGTLTIPYTGGDGSAYPGQTFQANGLTATLAPGTFAVGNGTLQLSVTGFPISSGSAVFNITVNGSTCSTITLPVNPGTPIIPTNITIEGRYFIASVYDQDYSPFTIPTGPATTARPVAADGINETLVDLQGIIPTSGLTVYIPATATGSGTIGAWSQTINIPANLTEDGISRNITLSWNSQSYNASTKSITATLKSEVGTLNARKLDVNAGIGNDYLGVLLGKFLLPNSGAQKGYEVRIIAAIPDRMFNEPDVQGNFNHNFLYLPIQAEDNNVWLNHNLGADYTNVNGPNFNLGQKATSSSDYRAYGSLFQWGRRPDAHELITWTGPNNGTPVNGNTNTKSDVPANPLFIAVGGDWRVNPNSNLWDNSTSTNNPCPVGFKVPTRAQLSNYLNSNVINGASGASASKLGLTVPGIRDAGQGTLSSVYTGQQGFYWSSTTDAVANPAAYVLQIPTFGTANTTSGSSKSQGSSVRCIKE